MKKYYQNLPDHLKGYLLVLGFILGATISYLLVDFTYRSVEGISAVNVMFWGFWGGIIMIMPFYLASSQRRVGFITEFRLHKKLIFMISILTAVGSFLWFLAVSQAGSGPIALLSKSETIFAFLLGFLFLHEKVSLRELLGILIAIIGIFLISNLDGKTSLGSSLLVLVSTSLYALQSLLVKKFGKNITAMPFSLLRVLLISIILAIIFLPQGKITLVSPIVFLILGISQVFGFFLGRICYFEAHKFLPISKLNFFLLIEPVFVLIGAYLLFGDIISWQKFMGAVLILGGLLFFIREQLKLKRL